MGHSKRVIAVALATALAGPVASRAAWRDDVALSGYVRESPLVWSAPSVLGTGASDTERNITNLIHTRQNFRGYLSSSVTLGLELKTRLVTGDAAQDFLSLTNIAGRNREYFDWEHRFVDEERVVLAMVLDRAWLNANAGPVEITLGRQRIAWGTGLLWNPIDIFNPSSPLDFDNEEKPGTDAGRAQYYFGPNSKVEVAVAPVRETDETVGAMQLVVNRAGYDWIALAGRRGPATVFGGAWSGSIKGGGLRGELLYSIPRDGRVSPVDSTVEQSGLLASVDGDYTFANTLYLHGAVLYNERGTPGDAGGALLLESYLKRWLSPARWSLYAEGAKDMTPLLRVQLSGILNPDDRSWYVGPTVTWSAAPNVDVIASGLIFGGGGGTEFGDDGEIVMGWLKWSF
jgi:hypothetical protein